MISYFVKKPRKGERTIGVGNAISANLLSLAVKGLEKAKKGSCFDVVLIAFLPPVLLAVEQ